MRADRGERAGEEAERRRDERERARELDVQPSASTATSPLRPRRPPGPAPSAEFTKFSAWLSRMPGPSSVAPSTLSTNDAIVAAPTTAGIHAAGNELEPHRRRRRAARPHTIPASVPSSETAPDVPGGTRRNPVTSHVVLPDALPTSLATVSLADVTSAATIASLAMRRVRHACRQERRPRGEAGVGDRVARAASSAARSSAMPAAALRASPARVAIAAARNAAKSSVHPCHPVPTKTARPMIVAGDARRAAVTSLRRHPARATTTLVASAGRMRAVTSGSDARQADSSRRLSDHSTAAAVAGTLMLSFRRIGTVSTKPATTAAAGGAASSHHAGIRPVALVIHAATAAAASVPNATNATSPAVDFVAVPRQRPRPHVRAHECREAVAGRENRPCRGGDFESRREAEHEAQDGDRVNHDARRPGCLTGPEQAAAPDQARQDREIEEDGSDRKERRLPPRQPAQKQREEAGADVHELAADFGGRGHRSASRERLAAPPLERVRQRLLHGNLRRPPKLGANPARRRPARPGRRSGASAADPP